MYVEHRFHLNPNTVAMIKDMEPQFGYDGFGEAMFYRTYSRDKGPPDHRAETWHDVIIRNTEGTFSIRKDWYKKNCISWDEEYWQQYAVGFMLSMFNMEWLPPGRGLFHMGTDFMYERGSMCLYSCAYTRLTGDQFDEDISWMMDSLMLGVGVSGWPMRGDVDPTPKLKLYKPVGTFDYEIPDSREGWAESDRLLLNAVIRPDQKMPRMVYDKIRSKNTPIKGFGGLCSGPEPLIEHHQYLLGQIDSFRDEVEFKTNIGNSVGCCVVAGNVRRSAELMRGSINDPVFVDLKDYTKYPDRASVGWMSNNSVALYTDEEFDMLGEIAKRVKKNGEPGYLNLRNFPKARIGKRNKYPKDKAECVNPCGEIPLEHREVCNLAETFPTVCRPRKSREGYNISSSQVWEQDACEYASLYCSSVSLLPTHQPSTNLVVARNRRIGVGIVDYVGWVQSEGVHKVTRYLRNGYKQIRRINNQVNRQAGVPPALRVTTMKPGGTVPKLPGRVSGGSYPTFRHTLRRFNVGDNQPMAKLLIEAGVPYEESAYSKNTLVFAWPIVQGLNHALSINSNHTGPGNVYCKTAEEVTIWEQAFNVITLQREWADNAVSNTLYFRPMWTLCEVIEQDFVNKMSSYIGQLTAMDFWRDDESLELEIPERYKFVKKLIGDRDRVYQIHVHEFDPKNEEADIEPVLSAIAPLVKSISVLPHTPNGVYKQMPEEGISERYYHELREQIRPIDWTKLRHHQGTDEKFCVGPACELPSNQEPETISNLPESP